MNMEVEDIIKNKDNKEYILKAVKERGKNLEYASENLQEDIDVVKEALKK